VRNYGYPDLRIVAETAEPSTGEDGSCESGSGGRLEYRARWAFAVNLPCYAGGLQVAPNAVGSDGLLDVTTFDKGSFWHGLRYVGLVALGWHQILSDCRSTRVKRVRIESNEEVPYQLDGDPGGTLPLDIEVLVERLTVLAPRARLVELGGQLTPTTDAKVAS
jgi:diacylglycerol kinase (ATP)